MTATRIPYDALGMELTSDYDEKSALFGYKTAFGFIGRPRPPPPPQHPFPTSPRRLAAHHVCSPVTALPSLPFS